MKLMIASDLHGSAFYCEALLKAYHQEQPDRLLFLGDILYHGPRNDLPKEYNPKQVIPLLNDIRDRLLCVRGNCDCDVDQMVLEFPILAESCLLYTGSRAIFATHGHIYGPDHPPLMQPGDILLCGHTHVPACTKIGNFWYLNPGSVSIPKENSPHSYLLLEEDTFTWKDLSGQVYQVRSLAELTV